MVGDVLATSHIENQLSYKYHYYVPKIISRLLHEDFVNSRFT